MEKKLVGYQKVKKYGLQSMGLQVLMAHQMNQIDFMIRSLLMVDYLDFQKGELIILLKENVFKQQKMYGLIPIW